jgi:hypothetical protein
MSNETKPGVVALHILCAICGERYGNHYGPFCDHSYKQRLFHNRAFIPAAQSPSGQQPEPVTTALSMLYREAEAAGFDVTSAAMQAARAALAANQKEGQA